MLCHRSTFLYDEYESVGVGKVHKDTSQTRDLNKQIPGWDSTELEC
jgi:hypothetical protein